MHLKIRNEHAAKFPFARIFSPRKNFSVVYNLSPLVTGKNQLKKLPMKETLSSQKYYSKLRKFFPICFITSQTSPTSSKGLVKLFGYTCLSYSLVRTCFYLEKGSNYPNLLFQKNKKIKWKKMTKCFYFILILVLSV